MRTYLHSNAVGAASGKAGGAPGGSPQRGAILLGLVAGLATIAAVGAAVISSTNVSTFNQVNANHAVKAYYLAESGYRYVGSQYLHAADKDDALIKLHDRTFTLQKPDGRFHLRVHPRFYRTMAASTGGKLETRIPGGLADNAHIPPTGFLRIGDTFFSYGKRGDPWQDKDLAIRVEFHGLANLTTPGGPINIPAGAIVRNVVRSTASPKEQTVNREGNLLIHPDQAAAFPLLNGTFMVGTDNTAYIYRTLERDGANWRLTGIRRLHEPAALFTLNVPANSHITLLKFLEVVSTGTVGAGMFTSSRTVTYSGPIAATPEDQGGSLVTVPSLGTLAAADGGTSTGQFITVTLQGNDVLHIDQTTGGSGQGNQPSVEAFVMQPEATPNPFYLSWRAAGNFLSYDLQVKIATGTWDKATSSFINKPLTYCAGITFRATEVHKQSTFYGLSFMRSNLGSGDGTDGIQDNMIEGSLIPQNRAVVVLWTRNGNGDNYWLAHSLLDETTGNDFVVETGGRLRDWSSLLVRVVEAASIKLDATEAPEIRPGQTIRGREGVGEARVYRLIHDHDGRVVVLLNNVDNFTRPTTVGASRTTVAAWDPKNDGLRPRDNYIWAMFADTDNRPVHNADPADNTRHAQPWITTGDGRPNWPLTDIQTWSAPEDRFTLVRWGTDLNRDSKNGDPTLHRMGAGREANAIIRTRLWTTGGYTTANFPPEIGVVSLGRTSVQTYFDDLAFHLRGAGDRPGFVGLHPPVVQ